MVLQSVLWLLVCLTVTESCSQILPYGRLVCPKVVKSVLRFCSLSFGLKYVLWSYGVSYGSLNFLMVVFYGSLWPCGMSRGRLDYIVIVQYIVWLYIMSCDPGEPFIKIT